jgi:hypothetical protein
MKFVTSSWVFINLTVFMILLLINFTTSVSKLKNDISGKNKFLFESSMMFKSETRNLFENLYLSSNFKTLCEDKLNEKRKRKGIEYR